MKSRCVEIVFRRPKVGPKTTEERKKRQELETNMLKGYFSSALGWILSLANALEGEGSNGQDLPMNRVCVRVGLF